MRCGRLRREAARRLARRHRKDDRGLRGGLPPRRAGGKRARCAAWLHRARGRPPGLATLGSDGVAPPRRTLRDYRDAASELRSPEETCCCAGKRSACAAPRDATPAARRHAARRRSGGWGLRPSPLLLWSKRGGRLIAPEQPDQLALDAHAIGRQDSDLVGGIRGLERNRGAAAAETLERRLFFVDQRHHDIAGIGPIGLLE